MTRKFSFMICVYLITISCQNSQEIPLLKFTSEQVTNITDSSLTNCFRFKEKLLCFDTKGEITKVSANHITNYKEPKLDFQNRSYSIHSFKDSILLNIWDRKAINTTYTLNENYEWNQLPENIYPILYEDEDFKVTECCVGEFGGSTFFQNKNSNTITSYPSTCARSLLKFNRKYWLASSLAHMTAYSEIIEIEDPDKLYQLPNQNLLHDCNWWNAEVTFDNWQQKMKELTVGSNLVFDTTSVNLLTIFNYKDQIFSINSDYDRTFLAALVDSHFVEIRDLLDIPISPVKYKLNQNDKGFLIYSKQREWTGILEHVDDSLKLITFQ